jgi:hypothetical protein
MDRKRVHIGAQTHGTALARFIAIYPGDDTRHTDASLIGDTEFVEMSTHPICGLLFFETELRVFVQLMTQGHQVFRRFVYRGLLGRYVVDTATHDCNLAKIRTPFRQTSQMRTNNATIAARHRKLKHQRSNTKRSSHRACCIGGISTLAPRRHPFQWLQGYW